MQEQQKMHTGELYNPGDSAIQTEQAVCLQRVFAFNQLPPTALKERAALLQDMFAEIGDNCYIEPPLYCNFGGKFVHFGSNIYANFHLTLVDDGEIFVGDNTMFGPNVTVATAGHPILPELRRQGLQYNLPVHIGKNCWIGAGAIILPGVTIGDDTVIGAGSVVTRDIPAHVVAVSNPCRVLREIGERDRIYYFGDRQIPDELL